MDRFSKVIGRVFVLPILKLPQEQIKGAFERRSKLYFHMVETCELHSLQ